MISYKSYLLNILMEEQFEGVIFTFGRMNPPTKGHEININKMIQIAKKEHLKPVLYLSYSEDNDRNPLPYLVKAKYIKKFFGQNILEINKNPKIKNAYQALEQYKNYKKVYFVVGEDRVQDFKSLEKYAKQYNIQSFKIISSGTRSKVSGTLLRNLAKEGKFSEFKKYLPSKATEKDAKNIFNTIQKRILE